MDECCHLGFHSPLAPCYEQNQSMFHNTSVQRRLYGLQNRRTAAIDSNGKTSGTSNRPLFFIIGVKRNFDFHKVFH